MDRTKTTVKRITNFNKLLTQRVIYMKTNANMPYTTYESTNEEFHFFFQGVRKKMEERGDAFISEMAPSMWDHMTLAERWVYEEQAQKDKQKVPQLDFKTKHCHGEDTMHGMSEC
jgi:hypothetical protein